MWLELCVSLPPTVRASSRHEGNTLIKIITFPLFGEEGGNTHEARFST